MFEKEGFKPVLCFAESSILIVWKNKTCAWPIFLTISQRILKDRTTRFPSLTLTWATSWRQKMHEHSNSCYCISYLGTPHNLLPSQSWHFDEIFLQPVMISQTVLCAMSWQPRFEIFEGSRACFWKNCFKSFFMYLVVNVLHAIH